VRAGVLRVSFTAKVIVVNEELFGTSFAGFISVIEAID
jgi:hypothetical protein